MNDRTMRYRLAIVPESCSEDAVVVAGSSSSGKGHEVVDTGSRVLSLVIME